MLSGYAKEHGWLDIIDYKQSLYDDLGNRISIPLVEYYEKNSNGEWVKRREAEEKSNCFVIDGKLYERFVVDDSLMPLNMDFNSPTCHTCYKVVGEKTDFVRITGNEILYRCPILEIYLHKQSYSDGTHFYSIIRNGQRYGNVNECLSDLNELIRQMELYNDLARKYGNIETIEPRNKLIDFMKNYMNCPCQNA